MNTSHVEVALSLLVTGLLVGCANEEYTLYLQDVNVTGPISQPPLHITNNRKDKVLSITPHIAFNTKQDRTVVGQIEGHSPVDGLGGYQVDTIVNSNQTISFRERRGANSMSFSGQNLRWRLPDATAGIDVDYATSKHFAVSFGANYSSVDGVGLWGYRIGLGLFSEGSGAAIRFDGGVEWQTLAYEARTVVVRKTTYLFSSDVDEEIGFFRDKGTSTPMGFYASLTFNTKYDSWFPNVFTQLAICKQSLASFKPVVQEGVPFFPFLTPEVVVHDMRGKFSSTVVIVTPGFYFDIAPSARALAGVRINLQTEIKDSSPATNITPLLEIEWSM